MMQINKWFYIVCCCFLVYTSKAQSHQFKAPLQGVSKSGFYKITITPVLASYLNHDYSDLRIVDEKNQPVPFVIKDDIPAFNTAEIKKLSIVKNQLSDSGNTIIIVEKKTIQGMPNTIDNVLLVIKNTQVKRLANISGSNDGKQWYIIKEAIAINENAILNSTTQFGAFINFTTSDFKFFKININNQFADPLKIDEVGTYINETKPSQNRYQQGNTISFTQVDSSNHKSYITLHLNNKLHIDFLRFDITYPKFFKRTTEIFLQNNNFKNTNTNIVLDAATNNQFILDNIFTQHISLVINNDDNPPLKINSIYVAQKKEAAYTYLNNNHNYSLLLKDSTASFPNFDIENFIDSIPTKVESIEFNNIEPIAQLKNNKIGSKYWLWPAIITALLMLSLLSYKLLNDIKKNT